MVNKKLLIIGALVACIPLVQGLRMITALATDRSPQFSSPISSPISSPTSSSPPSSPADDATVAIAATALQSATPASSESSEATPDSQEAIEATTAPAPNADPASVDNPAVSSDSSSTEVQSETGESDVTSASVPVRNPGFTGFLPPIVLPSLFFPSYNFPSFNSQRLDQELRLYHRYLQLYGRPDVMIVGSSRSLQGIDPSALRSALEQQGYKDVKVFNFGINGATAQVIRLLLQQVLTPEQMPKLIIWGDGSRAFNSGRLDATYNGIVASAGYQRLANGSRPIPNRVFDWQQRLPGFAASAAKSILANSANATPENLPPDLDDYGFNPQSTRYNPTTYFQQHPRVSGAYDSNYVNWTLSGVQQDATVAIANFARSQTIPLVFVSLPLTADHLEDEIRASREQEFLTHMQTLSQQSQFTFLDYSQHPALMRPDYFVDPSHINRHGASAIAQQLATDATIPWAQILSK